MKIIRGDRRSGKTTELIKKSHDEWKYIVCRDRQRVKFIESYAREMNIDIPFPIEIRELPLKSNFIKSVLIDDIEDVLEYIIGKPIDYATTSCEIENYSTQYLNWRIEMDSYFIRLKTIQETLKELDKITATKIEMNSNTYEKFMKYILSKSDTSKEFKTYLGIQIWQVENNQLPDNIARIKYSDGNEKIIKIFE